MLLRTPLSQTQAMRCPSAASDGGQPISPTSLATDTTPQASDPFSQQRRQPISWPKSVFLRYKYVTRNHSNRNTPFTPSLKWHYLLENCTALVFFELLQQPRACQDTTPSAGALPPSANRQRLQPRPKALTTKRHGKWCCHTRRSAQHAPQWPPDLDLIASFLSPIAATAPRHEGTSSPSHVAVKSCLVTWKGADPIRRFSAAEGVLPAL